MAEEGVQKNRICGFHSSAYILLPYRTHSILGPNILLLANTGAITTVRVILDKAGDRE
jgi:hypothetical protein